jgi:hypothetical protein
MTESKRKAQREKCYAKVWIKNENLPGYLRDISSIGCKLEFLMPVSWKEGDRKKLMIIPEPETGLKPEEIDIEIKWQKKEEGFYSIGGLLLDISGGKGNSNFEALLNYYKE